jgi:protein TonB
VPSPAAPSPDPTPPTKFETTSTPEPTPPTPVEATSPAEPTGAQPNPGPIVGAAESEATPPECVKCPPPVYPLIALRLKREGTIVLRVLIDENGRVKQVIVVAGVEQLTEAAVAAVSKWTYRPAMMRGAPVPVWREVPIRFDLPR